MTAGSEASEAAGEFVIRREVDAPRRLVFEAFADPSRLVRWFGPRAFTNRCRGTGRASASRSVWIGSSGVVRVRSRLRWLRRSQPFWT